MPLFNYECKKKHVIESLFLKEIDSPKTRICNAILPNNVICKEKAVKIPSIPNAIFQPYCFSDTGFSSFSDRQKLFNGKAGTDLGAAHRESKQKLPASRQFTHFKGTKTKTA